MAFKALTVNTPPAQAAHILAEDDAAIYGGLLGQDCVLPLGQKLKATVISNNKVRIADGVVSVGGHIGRVISGDYEDMTIANGVSGKKRNDIIAARFIAGASGGADTYKLVVIQGTAGTTASDPVTVKGDLYSGDKQRDYPLWRVKIEGLSIVKVEQMYKVGVSDAELLERMTEMNRSLTEKITAINSSLVKYKDVTVTNVSINTPDGDGYFAYVNNLDVVVPDYKSIIGAMVVAFDSLPGAVVPYFHLNQSIPGLYLYSSKEGTIDMMIVRVIYT